MPLKVKVEFAPKSVPLDRRLQTLSVLFYTCLFTLTPLTVVIVFIYMLFTPYFYLSLGYATWLFYDQRVRRSSKRGGGGRRWEAVRHHRVWNYFRDFFPIELKKTCELPPEHNYLFGYHPHGIMGCGAFGNFASEATGFSQQFPGIRPHLLTLAGNFDYPLIRALMLWMGVCDVSRESIEWILTKQGKGNAAVIVVGGAEEALEASPGKYNIKLLSRKGFIRMAIKTGACLVPVFSFGENDLFNQADNPIGSFLRRFQEGFKMLFGITPPIFYGRGVFNYTFGFIPFRKPVHTIVGKPIITEQSDNPEQSVVDTMHQRYMQALSDLFNEHKVKYDIDPGMNLHFI